jgi:hypothetical protein
MQRRSVFATRTRIFRDVELTSTGIAAGAFERYALDLAAERLPC